MKDDPQVARPFRAVRHLHAADDRVHEHVDVGLLPHLDLELFGREREIDDGRVAPFSEPSRERIVDPAERAVEEKADLGGTAEELMPGRDGGNVELAERA
jgi:hypothetical protein